MKKRYGKLVRDNLPALIRADGGMPNIRTMDKDEYRRELLYKLIEESEDLRQAGYDASDPIFLEEAVDIAEVFDAMLVEFGITPDVLAKARAARLKERGGFAGKVFLESVENE